MTTRNEATGVWEGVDGADSRKLKLSIHTNAVATVTSFNPTTNKVSLTVDSMQIAKDLFGLDIDQPSAPIPLADISVEWPAMTTLAHVTTDLSPGDTGTIVTMSRSLQKWIELGLPYDPVQAATHALQDSIFRPGLRPDPKMSDKLPVSTNMMEIHHDVMISIGRLAAENPVLGNALLALWNANVTIFNTHTHGYIGDFAVPAITTPPSSVPPPAVAPIQMSEMTPSHISQTIRIRP